MTYLSRLRPFVGIALVVMVVLVGASRFAALLSKNSFTAVGEKEWSEWSYRTGVAEPLAHAEEQLRDAEIVDLTVNEPVFFDEGWWRVMVKYYLPSHSVERIEPATGSIHPKRRTLLILHGRKLEVRREQ